MSNKTEFTLEETKSIKIAIREWEEKGKENSELSKNRTAILLKENMENFSGRANLYELYPPLQIPNEYFNPEIDSESKEEKVIMHVVVSGIDESTFPFKNNPILISNFECPVETYIFESDNEGNIKDWSELEGSFRGEINHERALKNLGYTILRKEN